MKCSEKCLTNKQWSLKVNKGYYKTLEENIHTELTITAIYICVFLLLSYLISDLVLMALLFLVINLK